MTRAIPTRRPQAAATPASRSARSPRPAAAASASLSGRLARLWRPLALALVLPLVAFHGLLLWERVRDASLIQPVVALRWLLSAVVLALVFELRRRAIPVARGRVGLALGLVVLLLHAGTVPVPTVIASVEELIVAVPLALASAAWIAVSAAGMAPRRWRPRLSWISSRERGRRALGTLAFAVPCSLPRPPPA
jgi:FtsH-binding integral membrane protein